MNKATKEMNIKKKNKKIYLKAFLINVFFFFFNFISLLVQEISDFLDKYFSPQVNIL